MGVIRVLFSAAEIAARVDALAGEIARINPGGGTEIFPALDAAYQ